MKRLEMVLDPTACDGHGLCHELFPEGIALDDWGFPIIGRGPIPRALLPHARRAAAACPKLALTLQAVEAAPHRTGNDQGTHAKPLPSRRYP
jgi:ferredoxin